MHRIGHIEIPTTNFKVTKKFFGEIFGWKFEEVPEWNYMLFYAPQKPHGGFYLVKKIPKKQTIIPYIEVESIDLKLNEIKKYKGKVVIEKSPIGKIGYWAKFETPDGCQFALWQSAKKKSK